MGRLLTGRALSRLETPGTEAAGTFFKTSPRTGTLSIEALNEALTGPTTGTGTDTEPVTWAGAEVVGAEADTDAWAPDPADTAPEIPPAVTEAEACGVAVFFWWRGFTGFTVVGVLA